MTSSLAQMVQQLENNQMEMICITNLSNVPDDNHGQESQKSWSLG
jgi:hypothetical protein